jgi:N-acetylglucosaminyl-diphospho-decaprenol L-rhamnosyltransferase
MVRSVGVIIVNYRAPTLVVACLRSLASERVIEPGLRVVVVDNASGDDSVAHITAAIHAEQWSWVGVVAHQHNGGFAAGNNVGFQYWLQQVNPPEFFWLLNPDTIVRPGATQPLLAFLDGHPHVGIVGSRLEDPDGTPQTGAFRFPSLLGELENNIRLGFVTKALEYFRVPIRPRNVAHRAGWVSGASMLLRREVVASVGLMDEGYFLYFEETDYCYQVRVSGWDIWHVPQSGVVHLEGQSTGVTGSESAKKRRPTYWFDSRARYFRKHHGATYAFFADVIFIACFALWRVQRTLRRKHDPDPPQFLGDFVRHALRRWV